MRLERALELRIEEHDQPVVGREPDAVFARFPHGEIAIWPVFEPRIGAVAAAKLAGLDAALELVLGARSLVRRDRALRDHTGKHASRAADGSGWVLQRIAIVRLRQHADEQRGLGKRQVLHANAEIIPRRIVEAVQVPRMGHDIHVACENLAPRQTGKNPNGEGCLHQLALETVFLLQHDRAGELLRDGAAALAVAEGEVPGGPGGGG